MMNRFSSTNEEYHSECEEINEEIDSHGPTTIVRGVCNQHSYMVGHATAQREIPQAEFLQVSILQNLIFFKTVVLQNHFSSKLKFIIVTIYRKILKSLKSSKTLDDFRLPI